MRRSLIFIFLTISAASVCAQPFDPFMPENPVLMGRGGSFTATATGYNSFFYNPAGFAREGELTLTSANTWAFFDRQLYDYVRGEIGDIAGVPFLSTSGASAPGSDRTARAIDEAALAELEGYFTDLEAWAAAADPADLEAILIDATGDAGIDLSDEASIEEVIASAGTEDVLAFLEAVEQSASDAGYPLPFAVDDVLATLAGSGLPQGFLRVGGMAGIGYLGNGIGLGLFANVEGTIDGTNVLQARGTAFNTITFVGGFGLSFGNLHLGLSIRPTILGYTEISAAPVVSAFLTNPEGSLGLDAILASFANAVYFGSGLGLDLGAVYELGPFSFGVSAKDIFGTQINYRSASFDEYLQALSTASLPLGTELTAEELASAWSIPMKVNLGAEFHPDLGVVSFLFDPSVSVDLLDISLALRVMQAGEQVTTEQILSMLNFGTEINLMRFLTVRGGFYGGYLSAGIGVDFFVGELNGAIAGDFGRDEAGQLGFSDVGISLEFALRF